MRTCRPVAAVLFVLGLAAPAGAGGLYRFVDENGVVHFTDAPADPRFRKVSVPTNRVRFNTYTSPSRRSVAFANRSAIPRGGHYDELIAEVAREHSVPAALVKAVIAAESHFNPKAVSVKGAQGLMQLMPATGEMLGVADPFEPRDNVGGGVRYLRELLDRFGDPVWAVAAYNAGPEAVNRHGGIPPYAETQEYVRRVMAYYRHYDGDVLQ